MNIENESHSFKEGYAFAATAIITGFGEGGRTGADVVEVIRACALMARGSGKYSDFDRGAEAACIAYELGELVESTAKEQE